MCGMSFFTSLTANFYKKEGRGKGGRAGIGRYSIVYSRKTVKIFFFFFFSGQNEETEKFTPEERTGVSSHNQ